MTEHTIRELASVEDATIRAAATSAFYAAVDFRKAEGDEREIEGELFKSYLALFDNFNRARDDEIRYLREEVVRLRMLIIEPVMLPAKEAK
jgi:hypothetical protein